MGALNFLQKYQNSRNPAVERMKTVYSERIQTSEWKLKTYIETNHMIEIYHTAQFECKGEKQR
jgi:hypothetical protein